MHRSPAIISLLFLHAQGDGDLFFAERDFDD